MSSNVLYHPASFVRETPLTWLQVVRFHPGDLVAFVGGQVVYYDCTQASHHLALLGVSVNSANFGQPLQIQVEGLVYIPGFGLIADQIYRAGSGGQLVTTSPLNAAFNQVVGRAKDNNTFHFTPQIPIVTT